MVTNIKNMKNKLLVFLGIFLFTAINAQEFTGNPIFPGYYADPTIVTYEGKYWVFVTIDPWGDKEIALWETNDFVNWKFHALNWPTKEQCQTSASTRNMVWAPSVIRALNGKFYMYISVGSEVYVGVADKPVGPWKNALPDNQPLVRNQKDIDVHTIDAEPFIDTDGQAYLYWGSGWNWKNGHCLVSKLNNDMVSFEGDFKDITPPGYFEAPYMLKYKDKYHLMYSEGKCIDTSYKVRYSTFDTPMGNYEEGSGKKILFSNPEEKIIGPGHHTILNINDDYYILYHRVTNLVPKSLHRQICIDKLEFDENGYPKVVQARNKGVPLFLPVTFDKSKNLALNANIQASSTFAEKFAATNVIDRNYSTQWIAAKEDTNAWLLIDLGKVKPISECQLEFEFAHKIYLYTIEYSKDNINWDLFADRKNNTERACPIIDKNKVKARYIRINFGAQSVNSPRPALWEVGLY